MSYLKDSDCCGATVKIDPDGIPICTDCYEYAYDDDEEEN